MPRFKPVRKGLKLLPVDFDRQVLPGSFEHALCYLVDHEFGLSGFHARYSFVRHLLFQNHAVFSLLRLLHTPPQPRNTKIAQMPSVTG